MTISLRDHEPEARCPHVAAATRRTADEVVLEDREPAAALRSLRPWLAGEDHLVVTTPTVHALYGDVLAGLLPCRRRFLGLDCAEASKTLEQAALHRGGRPNLVLPAGSGPPRFLDDAGAIGADLLARALRTVADVPAAPARPAPLPLPLSLPLPRPGRRVAAGGLRLAGS